MNWLNPIALYGAMKAYIKAHFWAWQLSSVWSWVGAFGTSLAAPNWAYDLVHVVWPVMKQVAIASGDVVLALWKTS